MKRKNWIILIIILIILATRNMDFVNDIKNLDFYKKDEENLVPVVKIEKLKKGSMNGDLIFQGVVVPKETIPLYVDVPVTVENILVKNGSLVKSGDPLLEFSASIKSELERSLEEVNLDLNNIDLELRDLTSGSLKLELENKTLEIRSLKAEINAMERALKVLKFESRTLRDQADAKMRLFESDGISSIEANASVTDANKKEAELTDQISSLEISRQQYELLLLSYERLKREQNLKSITLKSRRRKILLEKRDLETKLSNVNEPLKSPIDGLIAEIFVEEGIPVARGKKLISVVPEGSYMIKVDVPLYIASLIERGQKAVVTLSDNKSDKSYVGMVEKVAQGARIIESKNYEDKIVEVYIDVEKTEGLKLGYYTTVSIEEGKSSDLLTLNSFSVLEEDGKHFVYVFENGVAKKKFIKTGKVDSFRIEVLDLPEGTPIVVNPFEVYDNKKIVADN
ncbi:efflux RND transporter periplasmic adaptor subunit [uncultured Ilyobacter sp.]|uniref:efflux RND transporter periplasmic adaptor subunit n=1 Tax=uncultured Ilyobacter sp. TaxID=544433 RepID=UPI0029BFABAE|nr:efflux RND transporter periplasmic adaptor subunit [uncultured Ilyobacter sp.]